MAQTGTMTSGSRATVSVQWQLPSGAPAKVDGKTSWTSADETVLECVGAAGNSQIANLFAPGPAGTVRITASADADLGDGMKPVTSDMDITVTEPMASDGEITFTPV